MSLELEKDTFHFRFMFQTIKPCKFTEVVDKTNIKFKSCG